MELYLHSPIRVPGVVIKRRDNFSL